MTFIHGYLLAGLFLVGVPILLHLIMRQKPKQLSFPAFRFLRQKARINQRKIRLQHWLLLALRMLLIAALCFALARPRLAANRVPFGREQAVAAVFVFDTSPSMEYTVAGTTRLDDAKRRAHELLNDLSATSQIAVFDTADDAGDDSDDFPDSALVRARIDGLRIRPANAPVNRQIERAYRLLQKIGGREDAPPRFLFVFSDRTRESWDANAAKKTQPVEGVNTVYVDVGVDNPRDLSIDKLEIRPSVVAPGGKVTIYATVRATGDGHVNQISCQFDPDSGRLPDQLPVNLAKGESNIYTFDRTAPDKPNGVKEVTVHVVVKLDTITPLPSNKVRYATFLVRDKRKILTLVRTLDPDKPSEVDVWRTAVNTAPGEFQCDVKTLDDAAKLDVNELKKTYHAICLFQVPQVAPQLWQTLARFVENGGGLAIVPGGDDMLRKADDTKPVFEEFNDNGLAAKVELLPARFRSLITIPADESGVPWTGFSRQHPLTAPFAEWSHTTNPEFADPRTQPRANRYWVVEPLRDKGIIIAAYADKDQHPALLERQVGRGRVLLFTTQLGNPGEKDGGVVRRWQTYWETTFGFALIDLTCRYLTGELSAQELNYLCGQPVTVPMPPAPFSPPFTLQGPGLTQSETNVPIPDNSPSLAITQTLGPGNFTVIDGKQHPFAGFSLNIRPEEYNLERVPVEDIEAVLGKDTVLAPDRSLDLRELLQKHWSPPIELLPYLMMFILLALTVESLMANFFYRRQPPPNADKETDKSSVSLSPCLLVSLSAFGTVTTDPIWPWSQLFSGDSSGGSVTGWVLSHGLSLLLVVVPLTLIGVAAWTYFGSGATRRRVLAVLALRLLAFLLAILAILRPSLGVADKNAQRGLLIVAIDSSKSMTILDEIDNQSRWAYVQKLLKDSGTSIAELQDKQNVDVVFFRFAGDTTPAQLDDIGQPDGNRTDIGAMLRYLYDQRDQRRLLGLLVLSDGADNGTGVPPALTEAVRWRNLPCPIHTFAFGSPATSDRTRDIAVTAITTQPAPPAPVPVKALLTVKATIDAPGFENRRPRVKLFIDDKEVKAINAPLPLTRGNEVTLTTNAPDKPGEIKVTVRVEPQEGEAIVTNNEISTFVTVSKEGLRVLLVDRPRDGEPQSISDALSRNTRIRVTNVWLRGENALDPDTAALLDCDKNPYDVIMIGDVTAKQLNAANPLAMRHIKEHVEKGAGLVMIGGYNTFGNGDWDGTGIGNLLPVKLSAGGQVEGEVHMKPTEPGRRLYGYILRLTDKGDDLRKAWDELPALAGMTLLGQPRNELSVVLARADDAEKGNPMLVAGVANEGRVLAFAGDTTWRWKRSPETVEMQRRFWQRMAIWLAKQDETEGSVWVVPDTRRLPIRKDLGFNVGMKSKTGAAITNGTYKAEVIAPNGERMPVMTTRSGTEQRGTFTKADTAGEYRLEVTGEGKDDKDEVVSGKATVRFLVYDDDVEMQRRAADHDFLDKLAKAGGGKLHPADELPGFFRDLQNQSNVGLRANLNLYPNWRTTTRSPFLGMFFVLFVMVVSGEWLLRRRWGMV